jgi:acetyl coenzyme A synthetase (ADP forming)-like protein
MKGGGNGGAYPRQYDVDVVLRDGSTVHLRPILPADREPLQRFLAGLSVESKVFRFFHLVKDMGPVAAQFVDVDHRRRFSLIALQGEPERVVGHGYYAQGEGPRAEVAFAVADHLRGMGLGTILLGQLAQAAVAAGITVFDADVMPENFRMIQVFRESGFPVKVRAAFGVMKVELPTELTEEARVRFEERQKLSTVAALKRFFEPASIAVIGASRRRGTIGGEVFHNLIESGFPGPVYPVSPHPVVQSVAAYPDIREVPGPVALAVIVVPAGEVCHAARACAEKGVGALLVISAGFSEVGPEGQARQAELLEICRAGGMRLIGPNCMGILNTDPNHRFDATFGPAFPPAGRVAFMSQSGALGLAVIDHARRIGLGLSSFASVGNKADISGNDMLEYWESDPASDVILLYLESFGNPRRFSRIARRVGRSKPILAVKGGRTAAGARATSSHTGALLAASDVTVEALFRQSGVIRADTLGELFDVASLLATQPAPDGRRVGILTNAGGLGIMCADACAASNLEVPELSAETRQLLAEALPPAASVGNPVDMIASAGADDYQRAMRVLTSSQEIDALIVIFIPPLRTEPALIEAAVRRAAEDLERRIPVLAVFMGRETKTETLSSEGGALPAYAFPENAARALARVADWTQWQRLPDEQPWRPPVESSDRARAVVAAALGRGGGWLDPQEVAAVLESYGIPVVDWRVAATPQEAADAAADLGGSVALKALGPALVHKSEHGAVQLALAPEDVLSAARAMEQRQVEADLQVTGFLVQRMAPDGVEMIAGVVQDPLFGPIVACGAGGTAVELLKDVAVRLTPLTAGEADRMLHELTTFPLLDGYRGRPRADVGALKRLLLGVSALAEDLPHVAELDINPLIVTTAATVAVDARIRVEAREPRPPEGSRARRSAEREWARQ